MVAIAALHTAAFAFQAPWSDWLGGSLRTADPDMESAALFWALPGGPAVPALLTGMLLIKLGRLRRRAGLGFVAVLVVWAAFCVWLIGPSGFLLTAVTSGLLVAAAVSDRRARR
ncbi:hypothetical protein GCM10029992_03290 [Glycomyces albus]